MQTAFTSLEFERPRPLRQQIEDKARELLLSDKFTAGEKIPSTKELAANWGTNVGTVHSALTVLEKEGLLVRYPGKGTYVAQREEKLARVGLYSGMSVNDAPFSHAVCAMLREELQKDGIEMDLWVDTRSPEKRDESWEPLVKAAEQRRFQAFIGFETNATSLLWQRKLPVPLAFLSALPSLKNSVAHDMRQFFEISLRELARQGCRSVSLISPMAAALSKGDAKEKSGSFDMLEHFTNVVGELGLTIKNDWIRVVCDPSDHWSPGREHFGYEQFLKLWSQPEKPEGLLIFDDVVARGAITAIREKQVQVPNDLKLALHKNETVDLFCPMPATLVVASEREVARALISQVQKQFRGESCERISLPFKLEAHK